MSQPGKAEIIPKGGSEKVFSDATFNACFDATTIALKGVKIRAAKRDRKQIPKIGDLFMP